MATAQTGRRWRLRMTRTAVFQWPILSYTWRGPTITVTSSSLHRVWFMVLSDSLLDWLLLVKTEIIKQFLSSS